MRSLLLGSLLTLSLLATGCGWDRHEVRPSGYQPCCTSQPSCCDPCGSPAPSYYAPPAPPCGR